MHGFLTFSTWLYDVANEAPSSLSSFVLFFCLFICHVLVLLYSQHVDGISGGGESSICVERTYGMNLSRLVSCLDSFFKAYFSC